MLSAMKMLHTMHYTLSHGDAANTLRNGGGFWPWERGLSTPWVWFAGVGSRGQNPPLPTPFPRLKSTLP